MLNQSKSRKSKITLCFLLEKIYSFLRFKLCFKKEEAEEIREQVNETLIKAKKFEKVEENIPDFFEAASRLQKENDEVRNDNVVLMQKIKNLYEAEKEENYLKRLQIFEELGFHVDYKIVYKK